MRQRHHTRIATASAVGALMIGLPGAAKAQSNEELMAIIRQQQQQIEELSRKVDGLQEKAETEAAPVVVPNPEGQVVVDYDSGPIPTIEFYQTNDAGEREKVFDFKPRGRLFVDGGYLDDNDGFYSNDNATELRAARLGFEGTAWRDFEYRLEVDFGGGDTEVTDAFIEYNGPLLDPANLRIGQFKTPNSLEEQTSSRYITFMERAAFTDAFEFDRRIGIGSDVSGDNWGVEGGLFGQNAEDAANNEGYAVAGRGHYAFLGALGEGSVIHLGTSARFRDLKNDVNDDSARYRQRPFFHFTSTRSVDTGTIPDADNDVVVGGEAALVLGPFSLQGEAANTWLQRSGGADDATGLWGGYASASYFLTGESRSYSAGSGTFGRVKVKNPVHKGGFGAWEIGGRFDYIALNDGGADIRGGEQYSLIAGVNWYLNNNVRFMLDYAFTRVFNASNSPGAAVNGSSNTINGAGARFQIDF